MEPMNIGTNYDPAIHASPATDVNHEFWTEAGIPIPSAFFMAGVPVPEGPWGSISDSYSYASVQPRTNAVTRQSAPTSSPSVAQPGVRRDRPAGGGITR
jgi:hypothetical protein